MEQGYGAYFRVQTPAGVLLSFSRETWEKVQADLTEVFGEGYAKTVVDEFASQLTPPGSANSAPVTDGSTPLGSAVSEAPSAEDQKTQFETCPRCKQPKTRWIAPGVAKTGPRAGQPYAGFYGCTTNGCRGK